MDEKEIFLISEDGFEFEVRQPSSDDLERGANPNVLHFNTFELNDPDEDASAATACLFRPEVRALRDALTEWLGDVIPMPATPQDRTRAIRALTPDFATITGQREPSPPIDERCRSGVTTAFSGTASLPRRGVGLTPRFDSEGNIVAFGPSDDGQSYLRRPRVEHADVCIGGDRGPCNCGAERKDEE